MNGLDAFTLNVNCAVFVDGGGDDLEALFGQFGLGRTAAGFAGGASAGAD